MCSVLSAKKYALITACKTPETPKPRPTATHSKTSAPRQPKTAQSKRQACRSTSSSSCASLSRSRWSRTSTRCTRGRNSSSAASVASDQTWRASFDPTSRSTSPSKFTSAVFAKWASFGSKAETDIADVCTGAGAAQSQEKNQGHQHKICSFERFIYFRTQTLYT